MRVMYDAVGGAGTQERRKFLEQFLYLGWVSGDGGGGSLGAPGANKRTGTCPAVLLGLLRAQILLENPCL
jgi:hypothetical protein